MSQDDATIKCWGHNFNGQLGVGDWYSRGSSADGPYPATPPHRARRALPYQLCPNSFYRSPRAEMGENLPAADLGAGRTVVFVSAGYRHTCALLVRSLLGRSADGDL